MNIEPTINEYLNTAIDFRKKWDQRKLGSMSLYFISIKYFGLCSSLSYIDKDALIYACQRVGCYSGERRYPISISHIKKTSPSAVKLYETSANLYDRRTLYGRMRYRVLCEYIQVLKESV